MSGWSDGTKNEISPRNDGRGMLPLRLLKFQPILQGDLDCAAWRGERRTNRCPSLTAMTLELCRAKPKAKLHRRSFVLVYLPYQSLADHSPSLLDLFFSQPSSTGGKSGF